MKSAEKWASEIMSDITDDFNKLRSSDPSILHNHIKKIQKDAWKKGIQDAVRECNFLKKIAGDINRI